MDKDTALSKAKIDIITKGSKFLSTITFSMKHVWCEDISIADVDGTTVRYNPKFFMLLEPKERVFLLAHESWHIALNHLTREGDRDRKIYNQAGDYVINQLLVDAGMSMPKISQKIINEYATKPGTKVGTAIGLQDNRFKGMSSDQVYDILIKENPSNPKSSMMDGDIKQPKSEEQCKEVEEKVKDTLVKAMARSKMAGEEPGTVPGEIERLIDDLINPKLPWQQLLERFLSDRSKDDYSWKRPNKRFFPDFILPSQFSESLGHIAMVFDTSCSFTDKDLAEAMSEVRHVHKTFKPEKLTLMSCDWKVQDVYTIGPHERIQDLKFGGGGGTSFDPVFSYFEDNPPQALIYFTDLYAAPLEVIPKYPVIWICNSEHPAHPVGQTIYI